MNDHFVSQQLKKLSQVVPDPKWVEQQRQVMVAQVYNGQEPSSQLNRRWSDLWLTFKYAVSQPGIAVSALIAVVLLGGGTTSYLAGRYAKPGDSLYIAKRINERAQLWAVSFDRQEQNRLKLELARQRAAEMAEVNQQLNQQQAASISRDFKQTVSEVKNKLVQAETKAAAVAAVSQTKPAKDNNPVDPAKTETFSAATSKDKGGRLEVSEAVVQTPTQILEDAEKLFDNKQYSAAIDKLQAASDLMGSVK